MPVAYGCVVAVMWPWSKRPVAFIDWLMQTNTLDYSLNEWTACVCGCDWILVPLSFNDDDRAINSYGTHGWCSACGAYLRVPAPLKEREDY